MTTIPYDPADPRSPLVTLSVLDVPVSVETRNGGDEIHLLFGPLTLILLADQAADVVAALRDTGLPVGRHGGRRHR